MIYLRKESFGTGGPDVFLKLFLAFSDAMSVKRSSCGVEYFLNGANFLRDAGFSGGLDLMKSRMISWASLFTFNGNSPSAVLTLFNLYLTKYFKVMYLQVTSYYVGAIQTYSIIYLLDLISSISISYGVNANSIGVLVKLVFFNFTPCRRSFIVWIHKWACKI